MSQTHTAAATSRAGWSCARGLYLYPPVRRAGLLCEGCEALPACLATRLPRQLPSPPDTETRCYSHAGSAVLHVPCGISERRGDL